jgi:hypothetical protein
MCWSYGEGGGERRTCTPGRNVHAPEGKTRSRQFSTVCVPGIAENERLQLTLFVLEDIFPLQVRSMAPSANRPFHRTLFQFLRNRALPDDLWLTSRNLSVGESTSSPHQSHQQ